MKTPIVLILGGLLAGASHSHADEVAPAVAAVEGAIVAPMTAMQILEKSRATYAAFSIYKGSCSVVTDVVFAEGDDVPTQIVSSASAEFEFERGKSLSVKGIDAGGQPFRALWTPAQTWREIARGRKEKGDVGVTEREIVEDKPNFAASRALFASLSGATQGTGSAIPKALMPNPIDIGNPFSTLGTAKLLPARNLGNVPCHLIEQMVPALNTVTIYWIEQKTFLLRRKTEEMGEQRYDDLPEIDGKKLPVARIAYSSNQYVFATTEAK